MATMRIGMRMAAGLATSLVVAVPAHADNGTDFLTAVSGVGLDVGQTPADVQLTLAMGEELCFLIHIGYTPEVAARQVKYEFPTATPQQAAGFVDAARAHLCEQGFGPLTPAG